MTRTNSSIFLSYLPILVLSFSPVLLEGVPFTVATTATGRSCSNASSATTASSSKTLNLETEIKIILQNLFFRLLGTVDPRVNLLPIHIELDIKLQVKSEVALDYEKIFCRTLFERFKSHKYENRCLKVKLFYAQFHEVRGFFLLKYEN